MEELDISEHAAALLPHLMEEAKEAVELQEAELRVEKAEREFVAARNNEWYAKYGKPYCEGCTPNDLGQLVCSSSSYYHH